MFYRNRASRRALTAGLLIVSLFFAFIIWPAAQPQAQVQRRKTGASANSTAAKKPGLSREKRIREMWAWHEANRQRLANGTVSFRAIAIEGGGEASWLLPHERVVLFLHAEREDGSRAVLLSGPQHGRRKRRVVG